jgi:hypothetical protein
MTSPRSTDGRFALDRRSGTICAMLRWISDGRRAREQRRGDARAVRAEFELDPPRGLAALRGLMRDVGELERARVTAHRRAAEEARDGRRTAPARVSSGRR